jgi:CHAD domain-containing protein
VLYGLFTATPRDLFHEQLSELGSHVPGVLDGLSDSIHDARVATRRIREVLPLLTDRGHIVEDLSDRFKRMGKALGRVRERDVLLSVLASLETRIPHAAPSLVVLRQRHERERLDGARQLIKTLEKIEAEKLVTGLLDGPVHAMFARALTDRSAWRAALRRTVCERAGAAAAAIAHATGVYFPRRAHDARIAIKKFRYALEIAEGTGERLLPGALHDLKQAQSILGDLHDHQVLLDELSPPEAESADSSLERITLVIQVVEAENRALHRKYLGSRSRLLDVCRSEARPSPAVVPAVAPLAAGALAVSSLIIARRRLRS